MFDLSISDMDFGLSTIELNNPRVRYGARGIVENNGKIAVFNKVNKNEFKLPGGGVEKNEEPMLAFSREVEEEIGCSVSNIRQIGVIKELQGQENFTQISYVFVSTAQNFTQQNLTQKEIDEGAKVLWLEPQIALEKLKNCLNNLKASKYDNVYRSKFMVLRDIKILEQYLENMSK